MAGMFEGFDPSRNSYALGDMLGKGAGMIGDAMGVTPGAQARARNDALFSNAFGAPPQAAPQAVQGDPSGQAGLPAPGGSAPHAAPQAQPQAYPDGINFSNRDLIEVMRNPYSDDADKTIAANIYKQRSAPAEAYTLGPRDRRFQGGKLIAEGAPEIEKPLGPTNDMRDFQMAQTNPAYKDWLDRNKKGGSNLGEEINTRRQELINTGRDPNAPENQQYILTGKFPREDQKDLSATELKEMWQSEDEIVPLDNTITSLKTAKDLNKKTFEGAGSAALGRLGTSKLWGTGYIDQEKATATSEFGKVMSMEAIKTMTDTLKGATTNEEMQQFVNILADPSAPHDVRERAIDRMIKLAERQRDLKQSRVSGLRGKDPRQGSMGQTGADGWTDVGGGVKIRQKAP